MWDIFVHKVARDPETRNPYLDAQLIDIGLLEHAQRDAISWRRAFFCVCILLVLALTHTIMLTGKDHVEGILYKEDASGDIALIGKTGEHKTPSNAAVVHQLTQWIEMIRDIPDDPDLVDRNARTVLYMTAANSPAVEQYRSFILSDNPKTLAHDGYRRTVSSVEIDQLTTNTYRIAWSERLIRNGSRPQSTSYSGTVTLAQLPQVPSDPLVGQFNPAGIFIQSYDMRWSILH